MNLSRQGKNWAPGSTVLTCDQLEEGQDYYILFTASNGLYRYLINDIVQVKGFRKRTPIIQFVYRAGNTFDFTGEKLYETQIESSMTKALQSVGVALVDYTVIPTFGNPPFYRLFLECGPDTGIESVENLAGEFERELIRGNISYAGKLASELIGHYSVWLPYLRGLLRIFLSTGSMWKVRIIRK